MQFEMGISTMRYFPPKETAGFERSFVKGYNRVPLPPPKIRLKTLALSIFWDIYVTSKVV